jgi:hypothetical protein
MRRFTSVMETAYLFWYIKGHMARQTLSLFLRAADGGTPARIGLFTQRGLARLHCRLWCAGEEINRLEEKGKQKGVGVGRSRI